MIYWQRKRQYLAEGGYAPVQDEELHVVLVFLQQNSYNSQRIINAMQHKQMETP